MSTSELTPRMLYAMMQRHLPYIIPTEWEKLSPTVVDDIWKLADNIRILLVSAEDESPEEPFQQYTVVKDARGRTVVWHDELSKYIYPQWVQEKE